MKSFLFSLLALSSLSIVAQVGIGTKQPNATLDVKGKPNDNSIIDGIIPPQITKDQLIKKKYIQNNQTEGYGTNQLGALIYVTDINLPIGVTEIMQVEEIQTPGMYVFDGTKWKSVSSTLSKFTNYRSVNAQTIASTDYSSTLDIPITFSAADKFVNFVATLEGESSFKILEDGYYQLNSFVGLNPNLTSLANNEFFAANIKIQKRAVNTTNWVDVTGIRQVYLHPKAGLINTVEIPTTILKLNKNDLIRLVIQRPSLQFSTTNKIFGAPMTTQVNCDGNTRILGHIERCDSNGNVVLPFTKSITIQKF